MSDSDRQLAQVVDGARNFVTTHWSAVLTAAKPSEPQAASALEALCLSYWLPLYLFVRRKGFGAEDAQDLTQDFFAHLLRSEAFGKVDRGKGKFRSFLLASLNNFLANEWNRRNAKKRGGGQVTLSIDEEMAEERFHNEPSTDEAPDKFFDRQWATTVLERAMNLLAGEMKKSGKEEQFEKLKGFLAARAGQSAYNELAEEIGTTPAALAMTVSRLRQRYRDIIRAEVADTLADPEGAEQEIQHLLAAMA